MAVTEAVIAWPHETDECGRVFAASREASGFSILDGGRCLEVGSAEYSWLTKATTVWPSVQFTAIDWRKTEPVAGVEIVRGNVLAHDFPAASFDAVVSISTLEHIGLGHYDRDPAADDGDIVALQRIWSWLKPGGVLYFDVPFNAGEHSYQVIGTKYRCYDAKQHRLRLQASADWEPLWQGFYERGTPSKKLAEPPTVKLKAEHKQFYHCASVWRKPA